MSQFITPVDYDASLHREILDAITRDDETVVEICEDRAIEQMRCYLDAHYDCDRIFAARGDERHSLVLMMAIDIAVYHLFCIHNPQKLSPMRKDRYDRAIEWLKAVRDDKMPVSSLPRREIADGGSPASGFIAISNPKRQNHF